MNAFEANQLLKIEGFGGKFQIDAPPGKRQQISDAEKAKAILGKERVRPESSFNIRDSLRQIDQERLVVSERQPEEYPVKMELRDIFDEQKVCNAIKKYIQEHRLEPIVVTALKAYLPAIQGEDIVLSVDNQLQLDKLETLKISLQHFLMCQLKNGFIKLEFKLFDGKNSPVEKKLFTAADKFQHFIELNPAVAELKSIFGLEVD